MVRATLRLSDSNYRRIERKTTKIQFNLISKAFHPPPHYFLVTHRIHQ